MPSTLRFSPLSHRLGCNYRKETKTRVLSAFNAGQWWHRDIKPAHLKHTDGTDNVRTLQWARSLPAAEHSWLLPCTWCIPYITCNLWLPTATPLSLLRVMHIFPYHPCGHTTWTGDKTWQIVSETKPCVTYSESSARKTPLGEPPEPAQLALPTRKLAGWVWVQTQPSLQVWNPLRSCQWPFCSQHKWSLSRPHARSGLRPDFQFAFLFL